MSTQLQNIFDSITPENIKDIPLIQDSMEIFIETINERNDISIDISNIFNKEHKILREEFIKIYLDDLYRYFTAAKSNTLIADKIERNNVLAQDPGTGVDYMNPDFVGDVTELFTDEHFVVSKAFKQKKGTKVGIEYIYNIVESLLYDQQQRGSFKYTEGSIPFEFTVEGALYKEIYNEIVKPLSHPLGFLITYLQIFALNLDDYFNLEVQYNDVLVEVNCLDGLHDIFVISDNSGMYTEDDITEIIDQDDDAGKYKKILFNDGRYLESFFDPIDVNFKESDGTIVINTDLGETGATPEEERYYAYTNHCSLKLEYTSVMVSTIIEDLDIDFNKDLTDFYTVSEILESLTELDTNTEHIYALNPRYIGFICNETIIGQSGDRGIVGLYGASPGNVNVTSTDVYDVRNEVTEDFTIEAVIGELIIATP